jgi:hypothetical protein
MNRAAHDNFTIVAQSFVVRYEEFDGSKTPASILSLTSRHSLSYSPGGIGMLCCTHGLCGITGISIGGKKSSQKCPCSERSCSTGNKNLGLSLSNKSLRSCV